MCIRDRTKGVLTILTVVLIVVAILVGMHLVMGRRREGEEERENVFSTGLVRGVLRDLLRAGQARLGNLASRARHLGLGSLFAAFTVRRIYAQMSDLAARRGY